MDCVLIAGGTPDISDPLYKYSKGKSKVHLDIEGRSMLEYVLDALISARHVNNIVQVGPERNVGQRITRSVINLPDQGSLMDNVRLGVNYLIKYKPDTNVVLISSSDIPLITGDMVDHFIETCVPFDYGVYYNVVTKEVMEARFPDSGRTFIRLKDAVVTSGDIHVIKASCIHKNRMLWDELAACRKRQWKFASVVGWHVLFKLFMRQLTLHEIEILIQNKIKHKSKIIISPYAEFGMDVDSPHQVEMIRTEIKNLNR